MAFSDWLTPYCEWGWKLAYILGKFNDVMDQGNRFGKQKLLEFSKIHLKDYMRIVDD